MDPSFRSAQRTLQGWAPDLPLQADGGAPLETLGRVVEPPRLLAAPVVEDSALRARPVGGEPEVGFLAFLDGIQRSRVLAYHDGLPVVFGVVAAVIRLRVNRRLHSWTGGPLVERRIYLPLAYLPSELAAHFRAAGLDVVDTTAVGPDQAIPIRHPLALLDRAIHLVQEDREGAEQTLAERWCNAERAPIFIDGGLNKSELVARSPNAVGVVKSHRTLYVEGDALDQVFRLRGGERSSVFRIPSSRRTPVASWYLRLRDPAGHDPLFGLVRVEAADAELAGESLPALTARADRLSRWILAESSPLSLPDGRWDRMVYGIRDCEEYLRAVI